MLDLGLQSGTLNGELREYFAKRRAQLTRNVKRKDLRVTISWNTDNTDVDLWVVEPTGEACGYSNKQTRSGGRLLDDLTSGYGPERYEIAEAPRVSGRPSEFVVLVKYYSANDNLISSETHVEVVVERYVGTPRAESKRFQVILRKAGEVHEVCRVRM